METALQKADFEKLFLKLVYQTDVVITPANIAYHLNMPIAEAEEQLISLELNGVLHQETDDQGNTFYSMPNRPAPGTLPAGTPLLTEGGGEIRSPHSFDPAQLPPAPVYSNPGAKGMHVNGLVLNAVLPGVGSLVCGKKIGAAMLGLALLGVLMVFFFSGGNRFLGLLPVAAAYIWSIVAGIGLLSEK